MILTGAPRSQTNKRGFKVLVPSTDTALERRISEKKYNCLRSNTLNTLHFAYPKFNEEAFFSNGYDENMNLKGLMMKIQRDGFVTVLFHELTLDQVKQLIQCFPHNMLLEVPVSKQMVTIHKENRSCSQRSILAGSEPDTTVK